MSGILSRYSIGHLHYLINSLGLTSVNKQQLSMTRKITIPNYETNSTAGTVFQSLGHIKRIGQNIKSVI